MSQEAGKASPGLTPGQRQAVEEREGSVLVAAAAGSGKTKVLVERLLQQVEEGRNIHEFLVITFTKAAAAELRGRIAQELNRRLAQDVGNHHLRRQLTLVYQAQISTIHAFCSKVIQESGHLLDLNPGFRLCQESEGRILLDQAIDQVLEEAYGREEGEFHRLVDSWALGRDDQDLHQMILDIFLQIQSHPKPEQWLEEEKGRWDLSQISQVEESLWGAELLAQARAQGEDVGREILRCVDLCQGDLLVKQNYGPSLQATAESLEKFVKATEEGWDGACEALPIDFPRVGAKKKVRGDNGIDHGLEDPDLLALVKEIRELCKKRMGSLALQGSSEGHLADLRASAPLIVQLVKLVQECSAQYQQEKRQRNLLDFGDLEHYAVALLVDGEGRPTPLAQLWSSRLAEVMVDEYQDTNQVQNAIFRAVSQEGRKLFVVGDVKQSIYQFRLADPSIFLEKYQDFSSRQPPVAGLGRAVRLDQNFRSRPQVLEACNDLFAQLMTPEFGGIDYRQEALVAGASFLPGERPDCYSTELALLDTSDCKEHGQGMKSAVLESRWVAGRIRQLVEEGFSISQGEGFRPVGYGDMMILLRSPKSSLGAYVLALETLGIPWVTRGAKDLFDSTEVQVALSLLHLVDNSRQDIPLLAVLRSPVFGFTANELAVMCGKQRGDVWEALELKSREDSPLGEKSRDFLRTLRDLRFDAGDLGPRELLWQCVSTCNMLGIFGAREGGETRIANLLALYQLFGQLEEGGYGSLFACLRHLDQRKEAGDLPRLEEAQREAQGVSLMSIHGSKGLEKPVVFVAGLAKAFNLDKNQSPMAIHQKLGLGPKRLHPEWRMEYPTLARTCIQQRKEQEALEEEVRLLYVAMTRAREKLILTVALTEGLDRVEKMKKYFSLPLSPYALGQQPSAGRWVLLHAMARPEGKGALGLLGQTGLTDCLSCGTPWKIQVVDCSPLAEHSTWADLIFQGDLPEGAFPKGETSEGDLPEGDLPEGDLPEQEFPEGGGQDPLDLEAQEERARALEAYRARYSWIYAHEAEVEAPSKFTATQSKGKVLHWGEDGELSVVDQEKDQGFSALPPGADPFLYRKKPRVPQFNKEIQAMTAAQRGSAMHLVMQYMDIASLAEGSLAEVEGRLASLVASGHLTTRQCQGVSAEQIALFLDSPLGRQARSAPVCQQEFKFSILIEGRLLGVETAEPLLLQGVIDCWFQDEEGVTLIDFKSDQVSPGELEAKTKEHGNQMAVYALALQRILGQRVRRKVLWFFDQNCGMDSLWGPELPAD